MRRTWSLPDAPGGTAQLVETLAISPAVAQILVQRGTVRVEDAADFLRPTLFNLSSPFRFRAMSPAVERLRRARQAGEKVLVYGDYDVDGVTSVALLYRVLKSLDFKGVAYIPHRLEEGYGLHREAIDRAAAAGVSVIITVDCGITAVDEVEYAGKLGLDVIITDHHEPAETLPEAKAVLNPKLEEQGPFSDLAGVGVAFKLAQALLRTLKEGLSGQKLPTERELLDLVALGTIADVVPLVGENRIIVQQGLLQMRESARVGLTALLKECGLAGKPLKAGQIAFMAAPRINAAGRMDNAKAGLELLITANEERAGELARFLNHENQVRQETEKRILAEAVTQLEQGPLPRVIVLAASGWHPGVIGIVASRLVERYYRPVFLAAVEGEEAKGSARGIPGYHVLEELKTQAGLLRHFGGHRQAAGFSLAAENLELLRAGLNRGAETLPQDIFRETLMIDGKVSLEDLNEELFEELEQLAPFGCGNPGPLLGAAEVPLVGLATVGKEGAHLKLRLGPEGSWEGIAYRQGGRSAELQQEDRLDLAFGLDMNTFRGQRKLQLVIRDLECRALWQRRTAAGKEEITAAAAGVEKISASEPGISGKAWPVGGPAAESWPAAAEAGAAQAVARTAQAEVAVTGDGAEAAQRGPRESDGSLVARPRVEWLDWRGLNRSAWLSKAEGKRVMVWFQSRLLALEDFLGGGKGSAVPVVGGESRSPFLSGKARDREPLETLGVVAGLPETEDELDRALTVLASYGVRQIALAEFHDLAALKRELGYWERGELADIYRELQRLGREHNPFLWGGEGSLSALRIFEELGFLRCLGGTEPWLVEFLSPTGKIDLRRSLRYYCAEKRWEKVLILQRRWTETSLWALRQEWMDKER
ncbi:single-stranded-DNA-specific exonuclease RecJ [Peptococcaceae bacterium CEB3]|nr:single-stranded-DNA-specific exonuclease RecJ [Peptococcaceae bacterium CEB3]